MRMYRQLKNNNLSLQQSIPKTTPTFGEVLLLHCNGENDKNIFVDKMGHDIWALGRVRTQAAEYKFGRTSAHFPKETEEFNSLSIAASSDWNLSDDAFTFDCWVYPFYDPTSNRGGTFIGMGTPKDAPVSDDIKLKFWDFGMSSSFMTIAVRNGENFVAWYWTRTGETPKADQWSHVAWVCSGSNVKNPFMYVYINGKRCTLTSVEGSNTVYKGEPFPIINRRLQVGKGEHKLVRKSFVGYMDEIRLVKGQTVWTGESFMPPQYPYA